MQNAAGTGCGPRRVLADVNFKYIVARAADIYANGLSCVMTITAPHPSMRLTLAFNTFNTQPSDILRLYEGDVVSSGAVLATVSGLGRVFAVTSSGQSITLNFTTDATTENSGCVGEVVVIAIVVAAAAFAAFAAAAVAVVVVLTDVPVLRNESTSATEYRNLLHLCPVPPPPLLPTCGAQV
jgi:hypothetical protein